MSNPTALVQNLWNNCNILREDGLSYGDYVEQLTFLLFLKMADEQSRPPFNKPSPIPKGADWPALLAKDGDNKIIHAGRSSALSWIILISFQAPRTFRDFAPAARTKGFIPFPND